MYTEVNYIAHSARGGPSPENDYCGFERGFGVINAFFWAAQLKRVSTYWKRCGVPPGGP